MIATFADNALRSIFERWQRLEEEKRTVSDDLKDLFAEAKGNGFDTKALRAVFRDMTKDRAEAEEFDAIYDLYWSSLNGPRAHPAPAHEKTLNNFPPHDPMTGEVLEDESSDGERPTEATGSEHHSAGHVSPPASQAALGGGSADTGGSHVTPSGMPTLRLNASLAAREGEEVAAPLSHPAPISSQAAGQAGEGVSPPAPSPVTNIQRKAIADYRPHCQRPDSCSGQGLKHCHACTRAHEAAHGESEAA